MLENVFTIQINEVQYLVKIILGNISPRAIEKISFLFAGS